jgi:hypothetical protein
VQGNEKERIRKLVRFRSGEREIERERKREKETGEKGELDVLLFVSWGRRGMCVVVRWRGKEMEE